MKAIFKTETLILVPETDAEREDAAVWKAVMTGRVLLVGVNEGTGLTLRDLGPQEHACREPINVTSRSPEPSIQLISNFAPTPFELDGQRYPSVESFWQSLKFEDKAERRRVAALDGPASRRAGENQGYGASVTHAGTSVAVGGPEHWALMERACCAKFTQNDDARAALLETGQRPLTHRVRKDSRTIPGVIMANIWMKIRRKLQDPSREPERAE